jgi:aspartyl aminopeptidase
MRLSKPSPAGKWITRLHYIAFNDNGGFTARKWLDYPPNIGGNIVRWGLKNTSEKLEELREKLDEVLGKIKDIEKRLDETDARVKGINQGVVRSS